MVKKERKMLIKDIIPPTEKRAKKKKIAADKLSKEEPEERKKDCFWTSTKQSTAELTFDELMSITDDLPDSEFEA